MLSVLLVACSSNTNNNNSETIENSDNQVNNNSNDPQANNEEEELYPYSMNPYEIEVEPVGELYIEYYGEEMTDNAEGDKDGMFEAFEEEWKSLNTNEYDTTDKIIGILLHYLRANNGIYIEELRNMETDFKDITLPDGRPLETVKQEDLQEEPPETNVAIILDASGSMNGFVDGGDKMSLAKRSVETFTKKLPDYVNISLYVFGHVGSGDETDKDNSCTTIDTLYELNPYDESDFSKALDSFDAKGWTPIADSLHRAKEDLVKVANKDTKSIIFLISDGVETCDGDPIAAVEEVREAIDEVSINIIGFDVNDAADKMLHDMAKKGEGKYTIAQNEAELTEAIDNQWHQKINTNNLVYWNLNEFSNVVYRGASLDNDIIYFANSLILSYSKENSLLIEATDILYKKELITAEQAQEVKELIGERIGIIQDHIQEVRDTQLETVEAKRQRLLDLIEQIGEEYGE